MTQQRLFTDYTNLGDSGTDAPDAIQPVLDGEPATATVFQRPSENLRSRTEISRDAHRAHWYYRDFATGACVIEGATGHSISWPGPTTAPFLSTGIVTQVGDLTIRPLLTPRVSAKGALTIGTVGLNEVKYEVTASGYASRGQDQIFVEHRDSLGAALTCAISVGPVKRVLVVFDSTNPAHIASATVIAVTAAIAVDTDLGVGVGAPYFKATTTTVGGLAISAAAETFIEGTADQEAHRIASGALTAFTTANPLQEGDAVGVWYYDLTQEPPGILTPGGRWESNPDRGTSTVPGASFFITSTDPQKIPGAVALFKVVNGELVWFTGDRYLPGTSGPIGSVSGGLLIINDAPFSGAPTNIINGGIDKPLPSPTVQNALNSIDVRLGQLRTAWTCTDGVSSAGGHFSGVSAIQNAITAMAGVPGTLLVRRGTYTLPNVYAFPTGIVIITDGAVIINQAAPVSLSIGSNCVFRYLTINVGAIQVTTGLNVIMDFVIIGGRLQVGTGFIGSNVGVQGNTDPFAYSVSFTGANATISNLTCAHSVNMSGINNRVGLLVIAGTTTALGSSIVRINGVNCTIESLAIVASTNISAGTALLEVGGFENTVTNFLANTVASPITAGRYGVWLNACTVARLGTIEMLMSSGIPLIASGTVSVTATQCVFLSNASFEHVFHTSTIVGAQSWKFDRCTFSQGTNTASAMFSLVPDAVVSKVHFDTCRFDCARLSGSPIYAEGTKFTDCTFLINNPVVGGAPRLGGAANGQGNSLFRFHDSCVLDDCTIDGNDAEVNNLLGRPDFTPALFVELFKAKAYNLRFVQLNQHLYSLQNFSTLLSLGEGAELHGWSTVFTPTVSVQGGAQSLAATVSIGTGNNYAADYTFNPGDLYPGGATYMHPFAANTAGPIRNFVAERIRILGQFAGICRTDGPSGYVLLDSTFSDCRFGTVTNGCVTALGMPLPEGQDNTFTRCYFYHAGGGAASGVLTVTEYVTAHYIFDCCTLSSVAAENNTTGVFHGLGAPHTLEQWVFLGNNIIITATVPGLKPFVTGSVTFSATENVGAGNYQVYVGGTATAPSFAAVVNKWT